MVEKRKKDRTKISKSTSLPRGTLKKLQKKPGGSNVGEYKNVSSKSFAGPSGGSPQGSYPINTLARAKSALKLAHNAPNPAGIKAAVYRKYPELKKRRDGGEKK